MILLSKLTARIYRYLERHRRKKDAKALLIRVKHLVLLEQARERREYQQKNFRIGNEFEDYVIRMFDPHRFELIHRTPTYRDTDGRFVSSMVYPDLRFREISTGRQFWVEVKYRSRTEESGNITWCSYGQLRNYKNARMASGEPVFIVIGLGGNSKEPNRIFGLDLDRIQYTTLYYKTYANHRVFVKKINSLDQLRYLASTINESTRLY